MRYTALPEPSPANKALEHATTSQRSSHHHHNSSSSSTASSSSTKPPSVLRYTLILLKARPTTTDITTISSFTQSRNAPTTPIRETVAGIQYFPADEIKRAETPPPLYEA
jgi:hypothetical protein